MPRFPRAGWDALLVEFCRQPIKSKPLGTKRFDPIQHWLFALEEPVRLAVPTKRPVFAFLRNRAPRNFRTI